MKSENIIRQIIPGLVANEAWNTLFSSILKSTGDNPSIPTELSEELCSFMDELVDQNGTSTSVVLNTGTPYRQSIQRLRMNLIRSITQSEYLIDRLSVLLAKLVADGIELATWNPMRFYDGTEELGTISGYKVTAVKGKAQMYGHGIVVPVNHEPGFYEYALKFDAIVPQDVVAIEGGCKICLDDSFSACAVGTVTKVEGNWVYVKLNTSLLQREYHYLVSRYKLTTHHAITSMFASDDIPDELVKVATDIKREILRSVKHDTSTTFTGEIGEQVPFLSDVVPQYGYPAEDVDIYFPIKPEFFYDEITWFDGSRAGRIINGKTRLPLGRYTRDFTITDHTLGSSTNVTITRNSTPSYDAVLYWKYCIDVDKLYDDDFMSPEGWNAVPLKQGNVLNVEVGKKVHIAIATRSGTIILGKKSKPLGDPCFWVDDYQEASSWRLGGGDGNTTYGTIYTIAVGEEWLRATDWLGTYGIDIKVNVVQGQSKLTKAAVFVEPNTIGSIDIPLEDIHVGALEHNLCKVNVQVIGGKITVAQRGILDSNVLPIVLAYGKTEYEGTLPVNASVGMDHVFVIPKCADDINVSVIGNELKLPYGASTLIMEWEPTWRNFRVRATSPYGESSIMVASKMSNAGIIAGGFAWANVYTEDLVTTRWKNDGRSNQKIFHFATIPVNRGRMARQLVIGVAPEPSQRGGYGLGSGFYPQHASAHDMTCFVQVQGKPTSENAFMGWYNLRDERIQTSIEGPVSVEVQDGHALVYPKFASDAQAVKVTTEVEPIESGSIIPDCSTGVFAFKGASWLFSFRNNTGWDFAKWIITKNGVSEEITSSTDISVTCDTDVNVKVLCTATDVTFNVTESADGAIYNDETGEEVSGKELTMKSGSSLRLRFVPASPAVALKYWEVTQPSGAPLEYYGNPSNIIVTRQLAGQVITPITATTRHLVLEQKPNGVVTVTPENDDMMYGDGSEVILDATPDVRYEFKGFMIDDQLVEDCPYTLIMDADHSVYGVFELIPEYRANITAKTDPEGLDATIEGVGFYEYGATVTLTAQEETDTHYFWKWSDGYMESIRQFEAVDDQEFTAMYLELTDLATISVEIESIEEVVPGEVTGEGDYRFGRPCFLQAIPYSGYRFSHWVKASTQEVVSYNPRYEFIVETGEVYIAVFMISREVGKILCTDGTYIYPNIAEDGYTVTSINLQGKTPLGMVVIPASHTPEHEDRVCAFAAMATSNPEQGSVDGYSPKLNYPKVLTLPSLFSKFQAGSTNNNLQSIVGSVAPYGVNDYLNPADGLYYHHSFAQESYWSYPPVIGAEEKNDQFGPAGTAQADFDGEYNTMHARSIITSPVDWPTAQLTDDMIGSAVMAVARYCPGPTRPGDWYIPSIGELCYLNQYSQLFKNIANALGFSWISYGSSVHVLASTRGGNYSLGSMDQYVTYYSGNFVVCAFMKVKPQSTTSATITVPTTEHGTVIGGGTYTKGRKTALVAVPDPYYEFESWSDGTTDNPKLLTVDDDLEITATFKLRVDTVDISAGNNGSVNPSGVHEYVEGSLITVEAIPNEGYKFARFNAYYSDHNYDTITDNPMNVIASGRYSRIVAIFSRL